MVSQESDGSENLDFEKYPNYGTDWIYFPDGNGNMEVGFLTLNESDTQALNRFGFKNPLSRNVDKDITFTLYTIDNTETGEKIYPTEKSISNSSFNHNNPTKFCIHGWLNSGESPVCQEIKSEYLKSHDYNVFIVDWSPIALNHFYPIPMSNTKKVGQYCAKFLDQLIKFGAQTKDIHVIGHSLGAHISGFAGEGVVKGTICRITGLDPAQPGFNVGVLPGGKLSKNSANFVDIIHTCGGALGLYGELGHADFYPNGGSFSQPGCGDISGVMQGCSHSRSWQFFKESINGQTPFIAKSCPNYDAFLSNNCSKDISLMGEGANHTARGNYYLKTAPKSPYAPE